MSKELETVYVDFGDISAQATIERLVELVGIEAVKSAIGEIAAQQSFAGGQLPLCPECKETLLEDDRRWECVNESCGNCR